jgi:hypothetical protein
VSLNAVNRQSVSKWTSALMKKSVSGIRTAKRKRRMLNDSVKATARIRDCSMMSLSNLAISKGDRLLPISHYIPT